MAEYDELKDSNTGDHPDAYSKNIKDIQDESHWHVWRGYGRALAISENSPNIMSDALTEGGSSYKGNK